MARTHYLIVKANDPTGNGKYSTSKFTNSIVKSDGQELTVEIHGKKYRGKDLYELQKNLSKGLFPYVIEEHSLSDTEDLTQLGNIYIDKKE